jgi:CrcB protein
VSDLAGFAWVWLGAAVGAPSRYLVDRFIQGRHDSVFPWGTLCVNVVGSFVLGVLVGSGSDLPEAALLAVGTGWCGALTTYSTFSYETLRLVEDGAWLYGVANVAVSVGAGVGAALAGFGVVALVS